MATMTADEMQSWMSSRFRGYLPIVVDLETGGFNEKTDAMLELAAAILSVDDNRQLFIQQIFHRHIEPFKGANIEPSALAINNIVPFAPLRMAQPEKKVLEDFFEEVERVLELYSCSRAILTGHNAPFDLKFLKATCKRNNIGSFPFHQFSVLDTVSLGALAYGQTVLAKIAKQAGIGWDASKAHSAIYDVTVTAEIFCSIVNTYQPLSNEDKR